MVTGTGDITGGGKVYVVKPDGSTIGPSGAPNVPLAQIFDNNDSAWTHVHLEGVITLPNDPTKYGLWAGKIIAGDENHNTDLTRNGRIFLIDAAGTVSACAPAADFAGLFYTHPPSTTPIPVVNANCNLSFDSGGIHYPVKAEDLDFIEPGADFFGVNFSANRILRAPASDLAAFVGGVLLTQEFPEPGTTGLHAVQWDNVAGHFVVTPLPFSPGSPVASIDQWEHVTFARAPPGPGVSIIKFTNGADANDPNAAGVPNIAPGGTVTWTYRVTNTGNTSVSRANVVVTDNHTGVTPAFDSEISGNGDTSFDPGEVWLYKATGTALNLSLQTPDGVKIIANSCTAGGTQPPRTAYANLGKVTIPGASATDPSSYCNPPPAVTIIKFTNGADANDPDGTDVPNIAPGGPVTWTYKVTNTGGTSVPRAQVVVTDNHTGVTPAFDSEISGNGDTSFDPGEVWLYKATGTADNLALDTPDGVKIIANSCTAGGTQPPRTAYANLGKVTIPGASATDPSSYCNPPPPPPCTNLPNFTAFGSSGVSINDGLNETTVGVVGNVGTASSSTGALSDNKCLINGNISVPTASAFTLGSHGAFSGTETIASQAAVVAAMTSQSAAAAGLTPNLTLASLTSNMTFTNPSTTGGTFVIDVTGAVNLNGNTITFSAASPSDKFVINVAGSSNTISQSFINLSGIGASQILWNFTGAGCSVEVNKSNSKWNGTILAPACNVRVHNPFPFTGDILANTVTIDSAAVITGTPPVCVPTQ